MRNRPLAKQQGADIGTEFQQRRPSDLKVGRPRRQSELGRNRASGVEPAKKQGQFGIPAISLCRARIGEIYSRPKRACAMGAGWQSKRCNRPDIDRRATELKQTIDAGAIDDFAYPNEP
ncbi:MAG: hypothetical protein EOP58_00640 [Sphingomonadales bacterium]|nr:MAG: hypothetical protein EOP58_00640 [Sphingomonadales bacterium]